MKVRELRRKVGNSTFHVWPPFWDQDGFRSPDPRDLEFAELTRRLGVPLVIRDLDQATVDRAVASIRSELEGRWCPVTGTIAFGVH